MEGQNRGTAAEDDEDELRLVVGGMEVHPLVAAAVAGGALAAGAGAYLGARALARRNSKEGRVNSTLAAAITATDVGRDKSKKRREH